MFALASTVKQWQEKCVEALQLLDHTVNAMRKIQADRDEARKQLDVVHATLKSSNTEMLRLKKRVADMEEELRTKAVAQFTQKELRELRSLVHPDKHPGRQSATSISQKVATLIRDEAPQEPRSKSKKAYHPDQGQW